MIRFEKRRRRGLTLVEVLLVLVILVVIMSLAVTAIGPMQKKAYISAAKVQIGAFGECLESYRMDAGDFPTTSQGLDALRDPPADMADPDDWAGPYMNKPIPLDPWKNPYQYEFPGRQDETKPDIWSWGPDKLDGTEDDVVSWAEE